MRQSARMTEGNGADMRIGRAAKTSVIAAEGFAVGGKLDVGFEPDDYFVVVFSVQSLTFKGSKFKSKHTKSFGRNYLS